LKKIEQIPPPRNRTFKVDKSGITTTPTKLPKTIAGRGKNLWARLCPQFAGSWSL